MRPFALIVLLLGCSSGALVCRGTTGRLFGSCAGRAVAPRGWPQLQRRTRLFARIFANEITPTVNLCMQRSVPQLTAAAAAAAAALDRRASCVCISVAGPAAGRP